MRRIALVTCWIACVACGRGATSSDQQQGAEKPQGTTSDPVRVCERLGDVCKLDGARLGVCTAPKSGPGLVCAPQH